MKINEIVTEGKLNEGPLDFIKKAGAVAQGGWDTRAWGAKDAELKSQAKNKKSAGIALQKWNELAQNITQSTGVPPTPEQAKQWFTKFSGQAPAEAPAQQKKLGKDGEEILMPLDNTAMLHWLEKEIARYNANKTLAPQQTAPQQTAPIGSTAPQQTAPNAPNRPTSTPVSQAQLSPKTSVVSYDPMVIKYNNTDYSINDAGEWAKFGSKVPVPQALGKFLDQQEDIIVRSTQATDPYQQAQPEPAQPASRQRTGGRVAGQVSQTPRAIAQRQARAARQAAQTTVNPTVK
jgi:hypothetical protein